MSMSEDMGQNEEKILTYCDEAAGCNLLFFPEVQYTPFFPQYPKKNVERYAIALDDPKIDLICRKAKEHQMFISPPTFFCGMGTHGMTRLCGSIGKER